MIRRVNDFSNLSSESFEKIAKVIQDKDKKKLYKVCNNENDVKIALQEIKIKGYKATIEKLGERFHVYSIFPDCINLNEAENSGNFKKLAWGRYCFQKVNSIGNFEHYNFDDGTIWKTVVGDDGKEYLVKEVEDSNEDKILRQANLTKIAGININEMNINDVLVILYNITDLSNPFINDLLSDTTFKQNIYSFIGTKLNNMIMEKLQSQGIFDQSEIDSIINVINNKINQKQINNESVIEQIILEYVKNKVMNNNTNI